MESIARWTAIAIAAAAFIDPSITIPRREPRVVRIVGDRPADVDRVSRALSSAGFTFDPSQQERATVSVTDGSLPAPRIGENTWIVDTTPAAPNVRLAHVTAGSVRLPGQAIEVNALVVGDDVVGRTTEVVLEDGGVPVASARHQWTTPHEPWQARMQYLPATTTAGRLRVRAVRTDGESSEIDNVADVAVAPARGPARVLVLETAVTWPALFVRRALEGEGTFTVAARQRAASAVSTRAGTPPAALTRDALQPFEVVVLGGNGTLSSADLQTLQWFVDVRGGVLVLVPDREPPSAYASLLGASGFDARIVDAPLRLTGALLASEFAVPRQLPSTATVLAADPERRPVIVSVRRGAGAVVFSGALDAWRHRGQEDDAFARFWRGTLARSVLIAPPALEVTLSPTLARPGQLVSVVARMRETELSPGADRVEVRSIAGRAIAPSARIDEPIRLWPTAEPGVFAGEWRPSTAGSYDVKVSTSSTSADATITIADDVAGAAAYNSDELARLARSSGGQSHRLSELHTLTAALGEAGPAARASRPVRIMRAAWWPLPFALFLCAEWALRRKRGLA